ncbi:MAG TPA: hypothetical protein VGJ93_14395 [Desulfuromonadaceae bacterium]|jgi:hypothetical protein
MLRHLSGRLNGNKAASGSKGTSVSEPNIDDLYKHSRSGLWGIFIFLIASAIACLFCECSLKDFLPADFIALLGPTPPLLLVNCVLGVSTFCSLIIIAGRLYFDLTPGKTWPHLLFRIYFFLQYFINGALGEYYYMAFISGLVVLAFQHYNTWNYYSREIESKTNKCAQPCGCGKQF